MTEQKHYDMDAILDRIRAAKAKEPSPDFDLAASVEQHGYLDPLKVDAFNRLIDGAHRVEIDENWPAFRLEHIDSDAKYLIAMFTSNVQRRQVSAEEKAATLDGIAEITGWTPKQIAEKLGMSYTWVMRYLPNQYKSQVKAEAGRLGGEAKAEKSATRDVAKEHEDLTVGKRVEPEKPDGEHVEHAVQPKTTEIPDPAVEKPKEERLETLPEDRFEDGGTDVCSVCQGEPGQRDLVTVALCVRCFEEFHRWAETR